MTRRSIALGCMGFISAGLLSACFKSGQAGDEDAFWTGVTPVDVVEGQARRGPWRMNESDYVDDPTVAITGDGHVGVAWADQARQDVYFQIYTPAGRPRFTEPVRISSGPRTFSWLPRLVIAADDPRRIYALWQEIVFSGGSHGGEIFFARSTDGGATFDSPINLSNSVAGDGKGRLTAERWDNGSLDLAAGPDGHLYAAWTEYEGRLWVSRSTDAGATFAEPSHVAGDESRVARAPSLEVDAAGVVHLAWSAGGQAAADILVATSPDGGRSFGAPQIVRSSGHADAPKIAADRQGRLHLVYGESPRGLPGRYGIRYARRDVGHERFSQPRTVATADAGIDSVNFPDLAVDAAGRLYIVWKVSADRRDRSQGLGFTVSRDGGQSFAHPAIVPDSDDPELGFGGGLQGSLMTRLAVNADGMLALVDSTFAPDRFSRIRLWRRPALVHRSGG